MRDNIEKILTAAKIDHVQGCIDDLEIFGYREDDATLERLYGVLDRLRAAKDSSVLTRGAKKEIFRYYKIVSGDILAGKKACQKAPVDKRYEIAVNRLEGRLCAIRHICRILELFLKANSIVINRR